MEKQHLNLTCPLDSFYGFIGFDKDEIDLGSPNAEALVATKFSPEDVTFVYDNQYVWAACRTTVSFLTLLAFYKSAGFPVMTITTKEIRDLDIFEKLEEDREVKGAGTDDWTCLCRNNTHAEGFHPCNINGDYVEPDENWKGFYLCDRCGRIINQEGTIIRYKD